MEHTALASSDTGPRMIHVCLDEEKTLSVALAHHLKGDPYVLEMALNEWKDGSLETDHAALVSLPLLCLTQDHLCILRRGGRVFVIYAHPYHDRAHVARVICDLHNRLHYGPHAVILKNSTCETRIRSVFDPSSSLAEAA